MRGYVEDEAFPGAGRQDRIPWQAWAMSGQIVRMIHGPGRVVVAFRLSRSANERLRGMVGADTRLVDLRESDGHERLVLAPPASPQLLGKLRQAFPDARIVVVELTDIDAGIRQGGPVTRSIDSGADSYVVVRSLDQLAEMVESAVGTPKGAHLPAELMAEAEDDLSALLEEVLARREAAHRARPAGPSRQEASPNHLPGPSSRHAGSPGADNERL